MNYTKGEWKSENGFVFCLNSHGTNRFDFSINAGRTDTKERTPISEIEANANLITAAPDMYEALKTLMFQFSVAVDDVRSKDKEVYEQAEKALAKAEGK